MDIANNTTLSARASSGWFKNPVENRLRGGWRLLIQGLIFFGGSFLLQMLLGIGVGIFAVASGMDLTDPNIILDITHRPLIRLMTALISLGIVLLSCGFAAAKLDKRPFRDYGFHLSRQWWLDLGFGLALGAFLMLFIFLVEVAAGWVTAAPRPLDGSAWLAILAYLVIYLCVGFYEELLSRGYQIRNLAEALNHPRINPRLALLLAYLGTSLFFGFLHAGNPNATLTSTVYLMIAGLFLGLGYVLTGQLALPIGLHITWNFFQGIVFGFPVSGMDSASSFIQIEQGGPVLWTGGTFGPEAGLVGLVAIALGALLTLGWVRLTRGKVALDDQLAVYMKETA
jgi:membrane protease YdiL (CAAX protease family)